MKRFAVLGAGLASVFAADYPEVMVGGKGEALKDPVVADCRDGILELSVAPARLISPSWNTTVRIYHFNGVPMYPGPRIKMYPGEKCHVKYINAMESTPKQDAQGCGTSHGTYAHNGYHCPDWTNMHLHGIWISPNQDDVLASVAPGTHLDYIYDVPEEHLMGTHWYHPHHHGGSFLQVESGAVGQMVIQPHADYVLPDDLMELYKDENHDFMTFTHVGAALIYAQVQYAHACDTFDGATGETACNLEHYTADQCGCDDPDYMNPEWQFDEVVHPLGDWAWPMGAHGHGSMGLFNQYLVNGQSNPVVQMTGGTARLFRMNQADAYHQLVVGLSATDMEGNEHGCEAYLIARDGVFQDVPYLKLNGPSLYMFSATRADVAVNCPSDYAGTVQFMAVEVPNDAYAFGPTGFPFHPQPGLQSEPVFTIEVTASTDAPIDMTMWAPMTQAARPYYLTDLTTEEVFYNGGNIKFEKHDFINGKKFDINEPHHPPHSMYYKLDNTYEMHVYTDGAAIRHPYHQHITHVQIIAGGDPSGMAIRNGEWRDTFPAFANPVIIRWQAKRFPGAQVMHCHFLAHEDSGMMTWYDVRESDVCQGDGDCMLSEYCSPNSGHCKNRKLVGEYCNKVQGCAPGAICGTDMECVASCPE